jgi:hypothetical protein
MRQEAMQAIWEAFAKKHRLPHKSEAIPSPQIHALFCELKRDLVQGGATPGDLAHAEAVVEDAIHAAKWPGNQQDHPMLISRALRRAFAGLPATVPGAAAVSLRFTRVHF